MRARRKGGFLVALLLGGIAALLLAPSGSAEGPTIEPSPLGSYGYSWKPPTATVGLGGTVSFRSPDTVTPHGVTWTGGPEKPSCTGVPIEQSKTAWNGSCTFAQAGAYSFVCPVHPEMKGSVNVSATEAPPAPPPGTGGGESPLQGPASRALKLARSQRGSSVRGSINLSQASAGGRLEVRLLAKPASLSQAASSAMTNVGRLVRSSLKAGRVAFAVPLKSAGRRAMRSRDKLSLTVKIKVMPPGRAALTLTRGVVLHG